MISKTTKDSAAAKATVAAKLIADPASIRNLETKQAQEGNSRVRRELTQKSLLNKNLPAYSLEYPAFNAYPAYPKVPKNTQKYLKIPKTTQTYPKIRINTQKYLKISESTLMHPKYLE